MPKISIIVPVYKVEQYLGKCIESIIAQTYQNWELLLVNDGSPDNSGKICDQYAKKDTRIRVFHKKNAGVSSARNFGLDNATGDYIMFVDSDDWISNDCLEVCIEEINNNELEALQFGFISVTPYDIETSRIKSETIVIDGVQYFQANSFNVCAGGGIYKREIIEKYHIRFPSHIKLAEDQIFILNFLKQVKRIKYIQKGMYYYLQREDSAVHTSKSSDMIKSCEALMIFSREWSIAKSFIDSMIVLFIMDMIKNNDIPYKILKDIYNKQGVSDFKYTFGLQKYFVKIANLNFYLACLFTFIYLKKNNA